LLAEAGDLIPRLKAGVAAQAWKRVRLLREAGRRMLLAAADHRMLRNSDSS